MRQNFEAAAVASSVQAHHSHGPTTATLPLPSHSQSLSLPLPHSTQLLLSFVQKLKKCYTNQKCSKT